MSKKLKKMKWKTTSLMNFYVQLLERLCQIRLLQQVCRVFLVCLLYYCANAPHIVLQLYYILLYYTIIQYLCHQGRRKQCYFGAATWVGVVSMRGFVVNPARGSGACSPENFEFCKPKKRSFGYSWEEISGKLNCQARIIFRHFQVL